MTVWYVNYKKKILGPFNDSAIKELANTGKITPETLIRRGESGDWVQGGTLPGMFTLEIEDDDFNSAINPIVNSDLTDSVAFPPISSIPPDLLVSSLPPISDNAPIASPYLIPNLPTPKANTISSSDKSDPGSRWTGNQYQLLIVGTISSVISLGIGYLAGAEHVKYSLRSKFATIEKALQRATQEVTESRVTADSTRTTNQLNAKPSDNSNQIVIKDPSKARGIGSDGYELEASRREWISLSYGSTIAYKDARTWTDTDKKTGRLLSELDYRGHTDVYVELLNRNPSHRDLIRLFNDRMEVKRDKGWVTIGAGHWRK
ncbi:MAG: DUF4339 domain-containing protein [Pirellula sp.]|jgi:hypothetical protein